MYLNPKWILVDFLRHRLTDPRNRAEDSKTEIFTATANQTEFNLSPDSSLSCITSVSEEGTEKNKWQDYYIDLRNNKVVFFNGISEGNNISISYKQGSTNWIYPDKPRNDLNSNAFPRINILLVSGTGLRLGEYKNVIEGSMLFQIDIWAKEKQNGQVFKIGNDYYSGENLCDYLAWQIVRAFEDYEEELHPALYNTVFRQLPRDLPFNEEYQAYHKMIEIELSSLKIGRIE